MGSGRDGLWCRVLERDRVAVAFVLLFLTNVTSVLSVRTALTSVRLSRSGSRRDGHRDRFPGLQGSVVPLVQGTCSCRLERGEDFSTYEKAPTGSFFAWRTRVEGKTSVDAPDRD
ncbi:hypothetical protein Taro_033416 [Colocasia esculenta]|uniref:Uncharacterized protein n=1 Tax=Colocasia esculenta TaxID=4460 RepID=A0A843W1I8_COLES|nr:hypothetical protein [Colocasia esculenta]